jgi:hypothetical protein
MPEGGSVGAYDGVDRVIETAGERDQRGAPFM